MQERVGNSGFISGSTRNSQLGMQGQGRALCGGVRHNKRAQGNTLHPQHARNPVTAQACPLPDSPTNYAETQLACFSRLMRSRRSQPMTVLQQSAASKEARGSRGREPAALQAHAALPAHRTTSPIKQTRSSWHGQCRQMLPTPHPPRSADAPDCGCIDHQGEQHKGGCPDGNVAVHLVCRGAGCARQCAREV